MFDDILEYIKRPVEEKNSPSKKQKKEEKSEPAEEALSAEDSAFNIFEYFDDRYRKGKDPQKREPEIRKPTEVDQCDAENISSSELCMDDLAISSEYRQPTKEPAPLEAIEIPAIVKRPHFPDINISQPDNTSYLCTQTPITSIEAKIAMAKQQSPDTNYVMLKEIRNTEALKINGTVLGYVIRHSAPYEAGNILITDGVDEMPCAVCPQVLEKYKLEKDSIVLLDSPSVWRVPYTDNACVLNIVTRNVISVQAMQRI
ncbi:hypothetical protein NEAUS05_0569 [Nematocida ausubeli]|nr:hypothetical protein NEAUS07_0553 [Nematocida ausubeli]KAI5147255.1 hypothetical protein NEAUS05_0569 [Nematocida ausubeli]